MSETAIRPEDWPILCETCLGENPFVRMTKEAYGKACKVCDRPFTVYRWRPGPKARYKKTELCPTCAKLKNVCQTCVLDLQYGLPVQVRDAALTNDEKAGSVIPKEDVNAAWAIEQAERKMELAGPTASFGKIEKPNEVLSRLQRKEPYYQRNMPHLCSFFAKGECNRGASCPYRHEMPSAGPLAAQNIKDRFYGVNDPVAHKMLSRARDAPNGAGGGAQLTPPNDKSITTLYLGGLPTQTTEHELREKFYPFGELQSIHIASNASNGRKFAFVQFFDRASAEEAAQRLHNNLVLHDRHVRLDWGKKAGNVSFSAAGPAGANMSAPPGMGMSGSGGGKKTFASASASTSDGKGESGSAVAASASSSASASGSDATPGPSSSSSSSADSSSGSAAGSSASASASLGPLVLPGLPSLSSILAPLPPPPGMAGSKSMYASMSATAGAAKVSADK